jgi:hypothetical protein
MSPNTTPNAERLSAGRLEATTILLWCKGALFDNADTFGRSTLPHFRSLLDKGRSSSATAGVVAIASRNPSLMREIFGFTDADANLAAGTSGRAVARLCVKEIARQSNSLAMHVRCDYVPLAQFRTCLWPCVDR